MRGQQSIRAIAIALALVVTGVSNRAALCERVKVEGLIKARSGDTMTLQTSSQSDIVVLLADTTRVGQVQGVFKARRKDMSMAALIPGLAVKVEGNYDDDKKLVASSVSFKGNDLEQAESIQAGLHETKVQNKLRRIQSGPRIYRGPGRVRGTESQRLYGCTVSKPAPRHTVVR